MYGQLGSDSVLQWECPKRLLKRGAEMCWAWTPYIVALPARGKDRRHGLLPLSAAKQIDQKVQIEGISQSQTSTARRTEAAQSGECRTLSAVKVVGLELEGQEMST